MFLLFHQVSSITDKWWHVALWWWSKFSVRHALNHHHNSLSFLFFTPYRTYNWLKRPMVPVQIACHEQHSNVFNINSVRRCSASIYVIHQWATVFRNHLAAKWGFFFFFLQWSEAIVNIFKSSWDRKLLV